MIAPNELRVGNFIRQIKYMNGSCDVIRKTSAINKEGYLSVVVIESNNTMSKHPISWFEPIPLTEDWLLKMGFDRKKNYVTEYFQYGKMEKYRIHCYKDGAMQLALPISDENGVVTFAPPLVEFNYVHQLQNLYFALTGEELKIKSA